MSRYLYFFLIFVYFLFFKKKKKNIILKCYQIILFRNFNFHFCLLKAAIRQFVQQHQYLLSNAEAVNYLKRTKSAMAMSAPKPPEPPTQANNQQ